MSAESHSSAPPTHRPSAGLVIAAFAILYTAWGGTYLAIRIGIESLPPLLMVGTRYVIAGAVLYFWSRLAGEPRPTRVHWRSAAIAGAFLLLGGNGTLAWAEQRVPSGLAALLIATTPFWMALIAWWRNISRPNLGVAAGLALGFSGMIVLVGPGVLTGHSAIDPLGALVLVCASLSWAVGALYGREAVLPKSVLESTGLQMLAGGAQLVLVGILRGELTGFSLGAVTLRSWIAFGYLIVAGGIAGMTVFLWLMRVVSPARVSTYAYVNPMVAVVLGWLYAGEALAARTVAAAAIIIAGVILVISFRDRPSPSSSLRKTALAGAVPAAREQHAMQKSDGAGAPLPVACRDDEG